MIEPGGIFLIGDSHIGLSDGDEVPMIKWLDRLEVLKPAALYLNGDVFHYLIGDRKFFTNSVRRVFARLSLLRDSGVRVHYVEGNRDFFLNGTLAEESVTELTARTTFEAGQRRYLVIHGDMINDRDLPYRFWRRASKNPVMKFFVKLTPSFIARRFTDTVERKLARSNFKHKTRLPIELMANYGRQQSEAGFDTVVFGHFHQKTIVPAGSATVAVLPAWYENGEAMLVSPKTGAYEFVTI